MRKYLCDKETQHCGTCPGCRRNSTKDIEAQLAEANSIILSWGIFPDKKGGLELRPKSASEYLKKHKLI